MKVITSPTLGAASLTVLVRARSACCGVSVALALSLAVFGSNWSAWVMVPVLVCEVALTTVAVISSVGPPPELTVPTSHSPVLLS